MNLDCPGGRGVIPRLLRKIHDVVRVAFHELRELEKPQHLE
jgi:hypothetical protein